MEPKKYIDLNFCEQLANAAVNALQAEYPVIVFGPERRDIRDAIYRAAVNANVKAYREKAANGK